MVEVSCMTIAKSQQRPTLPFFVEDVADWQFIILCENGQGRAKTVLSLVAGRWAQMRVVAGRPI